MPGPMSAPNGNRRITMSGTVRRGPKDDQTPRTGKTATKRPKPVKA